jgi:hypothetical protein
MIMIMFHSSFFSCRNGFIKRWRLAGNELLAEGKIELNPDVTVIYVADREAGTITRSDTNRATVVTEVDASERFMSNGIILLDPHTLLLVRV